MKMVGAKDLVLITMSHNVSFVGKIWLLLMLCFRSLLVLLAGFSLFGDEQERFVCNTIQPGCSNLCFNVFCPVSILRLWLLHLVLLLLPHLLFWTYLSHKVLSEPLPLRRGDGGSPLTLETSGEWAAPRFHGVYAAVVVLRTALEAAFGVGQFFLFGPSFPKSFLCYEAPCTSGIECYVSRPTEKSLMLNAMLALAACSVLLSAVDLVSSLKAMARWRRRRAAGLMEEMSKGERSSVFTTSDDVDSLLAKRGSLNYKHANGEANFPSPKPEVPCPATAPPFGTQNPLKPPLHPRPDRGAAATHRAPTPSVSRRLATAAASSGQQSDSSDSQDHKRAWV
ncbi:gap junction delta-4 protein-like [Eucyclogobius newberryi]|uniref:gap junction delta-4 protein-like n=1 Tax=Eucyclogobius newberryi TaxID=166745 RepID=UPI003B5CC35E